MCLDWFSCIDESLAQNSSMASACAFPSTPALNLCKVIMDGSAAPFISSVSRTNRKSIPRQPSRQRCPRTFEQQLALALIGREFGRALERLARFTRPAEFGQQVTAHRTQ